MTDPITDKIAQTLCFASRVHQEGLFCSMCDEQGRCQPEMWTSFRPEAAAVLAMMKRSGWSQQPPKKQSLLPGLGG